MDTKRNNAATIAIGNQKGGVGKTTNCVHIAAALGSMGSRCLILDLDPAAGATKHLGVPQDSFAGTLELLTTDEAPESLVVSEAMPEGVHLIPARTQLAEIETLLSKYADRTRLLEVPLAQLGSQYDFIFLDTGPSAGFPTTVAAYCAAEWFILSAFPHPLSMGGLRTVLATCMLLLACCLYALTAAVKPGPSAEAAYALYLLAMGAALLRVAASGSGYAYRRLVVSA